MPEDKPYLQRVYKFLNSAYGAQGTVSKGAFTKSYDEFAAKIGSSDKYANKIYGALSTAYGPNGAAKRDAFTSTIEDFRGKVLSPKSAAKQIAAAPVVTAPVAQDQPAEETEQVQDNGPAGTLLAGAMNLELPGNRQPGLMTNQSAFEPLIDEKQRQDDASAARGRDLLLKPKSELAIDLSGPAPMPTGAEMSIQNKLQQMDEQDKNLQAAQAEADEFAKTGAGKLYYNFVRPVYQSLLGTGANTLAGSTRMLGDAGDVIGIEDSKKVLDKVADGLTDYFDFNRLAREGNTTGYLNMTPTSQQGHGLNSKNILPKAMESITSMATLIGGARVLGGGAPALFASNYLVTYEDFRKQAKAAGLNNGEADQFAITSAGVNSALLMISPETFLGKTNGLALADKSVFNAIKNGVPVKEAVKSGVKKGLKTLGEANAIVLSTDVANRVLRTGADLITGEKNFNESSLTPSMSEALETTVLTSIAMGALNGRKFGSENKPSSVERSAWATAAERPELIENGISKATEAGTLTPEQAQRIRTDVAEYKELFDALKEYYKDKPGVDISRIAYDAMKSKKQAEQTKPLASVPALKPVKEQTDIEQAQIESDIKDGIAGIPEIGQEITRNELADLMATSGGAEKAALLSENNYKADMVDLDQLYKNNEAFREYVDKGQLKPSENKDGLQMPVVMNANGTVIDGMNRLAQQYQDGNHTARAFVETKSAPREAAKSAPTVPDRTASIKEIQAAIYNKGLSIKQQVKAEKRLKSLANDPNRPIEQIKERMAKDFGLEYEAKPEVVATELSAEQPVPDAAVDGLPERVLAENLPAEQPIENRLLQNESASVPEHQKEGIDILYAEKPEIAQIGTKKEYSEYLNSVFPESTLKDVLYHGSPVEGIESFDPALLGKNTEAESSQKAIFLTDKKSIAEIFGKWKGILTTKPKVYPVLVDVKNPYVNLEQNSIKDPTTGETIKTTEQIRNEHIDNAIAAGNDAVILGDKMGDKDIVAVFDPSKIHVLGSKQDAAKFKEFVDKSKSVKVDDTNVADLPQPTEPKTVKPKSKDEAKSRRDAAAQKLKDAYNNLGNVGIISDPTRTGKSQMEFNKALVSYAKEEILYRANQVKNFGKLKKAQIKSAVRRAMTAEGVKISMSDFTDIFNDAYSQIKKIPGVLGQNVDRVTMREYIKGKFEARDKGRKEGVQTAKQRFVSVKKAINDVLKDTGVNLSMLQKRRIVSMLQQSLTAKDINKSINRAIDATTQMVWEQQHKVQIADTKKLIKSVNGLKRSKTMVLQDVEWLKQLQLPNPSRVDDLGTYQEMLRDYSTSRKGNNTNPKYTREEISEFVLDENNRIYKEKQEGLQTDLDALKEQGVIPDNVTLDEYIATLDNAVPTKLSEGINKKAEVLRGDLKTRMGYLKDRLPEFEGEEKAIVQKLTDVDISELEGADLVRLNNVLNNIAEYGTLDAAGDIITSHEARVMNKELAASGDKLRALPADKILSKKNISNYISALFYNDGAISRFRAKVLGGIENKTSHVKFQAQKVVKQFVDLNKKHKINGLSNAKLHAFSYLNQYRGIESAEIADNLRQRLDELISDATYLFDKGSAYSKKAEREPLVTDAVNRLDALKEFGLLDYSIVDGKIKVDIKDRIDPDNADQAPEIMHSMLTEGEQEVYKFVRDHYDELTDKLSFMTRTYAGKEFQNERNYVSLVSRRKNGVEDNSAELSGNTDITGRLSSINAKPANTTISRSNKKSADIYYDGDFFSNFVNRYYTSLYTAEVLPDLQRTAKLVNSVDFKKYMTGQFDAGSNRNVDHNYVKFKEKLAESINEEKYAPFFKKGKEPILEKILSKTVRRILGNVFQGPAQYAPAFMHNLTINNAEAAIYAAFTSRGKAIANPEYATARKEFLKNFTGIQRSALGSEAFDHYVKTVTDQAGWWTKPDNLLNNIAKKSSYVLEKADRMAQNDAYISSYITSLLKQGKIKSISEFDIAKEAANPNKEALAQAEQFASNINNESAKAYRPSVLKDPNTTKWMWLLQGFSLNAYQNAMNKLKIVSDNRSTGQERKEAFGHFMGYAAEVGTYHMVKHYARGIQMAAATALLSSVFGFEHKETEEEKKASKIKSGIKTAGNIGADFTLSGLPAPAQAVIKITANELYKSWAKFEAGEKKAKAKQSGGKFDPRGTHLSPYFAPFYGVDGPGGAADIYLGILKKGVEKVEEGAAAFSSKDTVEDTEAKKLSKQLNMYLGLPSVVLGSGDLMLLNMRMQTILKESQKKKKPAASGGTSRGSSRARSRPTR